MFAALCVALSLTAPATLTSTALPTAPILEAQGASIAPLQMQHLELDPNAPDVETSFIDKYLSFQVGPMGSKQVKDGLVLGHILGYVFYGLCGTLWGPVVATTDGEFTGDVAITWFLSSVLWGIIATAASFTGIGALLFLALPYLASTATFNELDRGIKKRGLAGTPPDKGPGPQPATPPPGTETPPPSYAY